MVKFFFMKQIIFFGYFFLTHNLLTITAFFLAGWVPTGKNSREVTVQTTVNESTYNTWDRSSTRGSHTPAYADEQEALSSNGLNNYWEGQKGAFRTTDLTPRRV